MQAQLQRQNRLVIAAAVGVAVLALALVAAFASGAFGGGDADDAAASPGEINKLLECRAGDGAWVNPLRPPRVSIG